MPPSSSPDIYVPLPFPVQGIDLTVGYEQQRPLTCLTAQNVRGYEPASQRARGGSRPGLVKYIPQQVNGSNSVQDINSLVASGALASLFTTDLTGLVMTGNTSGGPWSIYNASRLVIQGGDATDTFQTCMTDGTDFYVVTKTSAGLPRVARVTTGGATVWSVLLDAPTGTVATVLPPPVVKSGSVYVVSPGVGIYKLKVADGTDSTTGWRPYLDTTVLAAIRGNLAWQEMGGSQGLVGSGNYVALATVRPPHGVNYSYALVLLDTTKTVYAFDNFTAPDNTDLNARVLPSGGTWGFASGLAFCVGGRCLYTQSQGQGDAFVTNASGSGGNYVATLKINFNGNSGMDAGLVFRSDSVANTLWYLFLDQTTSKLRLAKNPLGVAWTVVGESAFVIDNKTDYSLMVVCNGTSITATVNGGNTLTATDAALDTQTYCGFATAFFYDLSGLVDVEQMAFDDFAILQNGAVTSALAQVDNASLLQPALLGDGTNFYFCVPTVEVFKVTASSGATAWGQPSIDGGSSFALVTNVAPGTGAGATGGVCIAGCATNANGLTLKQSDGSVWNAAGPPNGNPAGNSWTSLADLGGSGNTVNNLLVLQAGTVSYQTTTDTDEAQGAIDWDSDDFGVAAWSAGSSLTGPIAGLAGGSLNAYTSLLDYQRTIVLLAVAGGLVKVAHTASWQATLLAAGVANPPLSASAAVVRSAPNGGKMYFVDGVDFTTRPYFVYYDPSDNTCHKWLATAGSLPVDGATPANSPRLICTWRGRTVLSGLKQDGQNIFFSAVSDPTNWDYSPASTTPTQAVALNAAPQGLVGDTVTGLVPYSDDVLVIGGDHTLWMMRGDPMAGGQIDLVSDQLGMAWGIAWTKDPAGNLYFASNRCGIYRFTPGTQPVRMSQQIEQFLISLSIDIDVIRLTWDEQGQGLHVLVTSVLGAALTNHFFWEQRSNAWWVDQLGNNNHNPKAAHLFYGNTAADRVALLGSWDGYVRSFNLTATQDDGTPISSVVWLGPLTTKELDKLLVKDVQAVLGASSAQVTFAVYVGASAEQAANSTAVLTGTWSAGRNLASFVRRDGHALYVKLTSTNSWALEAIRVRLQTQGKVARRAAPQV